MKILWIIVLFFAIAGSSAQAQYSAQKDAAYMATLKVVADYKINDEENIKDIESLRENERFNRELQTMMSKLSNRRTKDSTNARVYRILLKAGKDIYNELH